MKYKRRRVIDSDNQRVIEVFDNSETDLKLKQYENDGRWEDVSVDRDGDIILWEEL